MLNVKISTLCAVLAHLLKSKLHTCFFCVGLGIYSYVSDTGQKEADDHFSAWNDSKFEDNTSLSTKLSMGRTSAILWIIVGCTRIKS